MCLLILRLKLSLASYSLTPAIAGIGNETPWERGAFIWKGPSTSRTPLWHLKGARI